MAERWQEIAHELGSWDIEDTESPPWRDMVNQKGRSHVGDYVKTEPACKCIAALEAEVERLTRQNAAYLLQRDSSRELRDRAQNEVERLRALVKSAFDEGMQAGGQGEYDYSPHAVDRCWSESCVKSELEDVRGLRKLIPEPGRHETEESFGWELEEEK